MRIKKLTAILIAMIMILLLCACGGNTSSVDVPEVESEIYTSEDINSAIVTITEEFNRDWNGCTLTKIYYGGDEMVEDFSEYADRYDADEVIVLLSSFDVDDSGGDGSLEPNSTYDGWNWILVRNKGGEWKHVDHGY